MSLVSRNPFAALDDDGDNSPAPVGPTETPKPAASNHTNTDPQRSVPGAGRGAGQRGRGSYSPRGGPRNVLRDSAPRNTGPTSGDGVAEGMETPGGFDGERVPPSRKQNRNMDAHTKGSRGNRPVRNATSGGHSDGRGGGHYRGGRTPASGGERRQFERRPGTLPDSQKRVDQGWGANEGGAELDAEVQGETDAQAEENVPQTPAPEGEDGGWGVTADGAAVPDRTETEIAPAAAAADAGPEAEPEDTGKSYDQYLAELAQQALGSGLGKKEARQVNSETLEGVAFRRAAVDEFFSGKEKKTLQVKSPKKEKVFIEVDGQFASPPSSRGRGDGRGRGRGRGGPEGSRGRGGFEGGGRGRGGFEGRGRGRGGFRGGRGAAGQAPAPGISATDESAFPALGA